MQQGNKISGFLRMNEFSEYLQLELKFILRIYKQAILHVEIDDDRCANSYDLKSCKRFKISDFEGVKWD